MLLVDTVQWIYYLEMCKINRSCCLNRLVSKEVIVAVSSLLSSISAAYIILHYHNTSNRLQQSYPNGNKSTIMNTKYT